MANSAQEQLMDEVVRLIGLAHPLIEVVARHDRDLAQQIRRALSSIGLNLAEGFGSTAGNARLRFQSARGSLYEAHAGLRIAVAWSLVQPDSCAPLLSTIDRLSARLYGLYRRR